MATSTAPQLVKASGKEGLSVEDNLHVVREFINICLDPQRCSMDAVKEFLAPNAKFNAPTTYPHISTIQEYVRELMAIRKAVPDLRITQIHALFGSVPLLHRRRYSHWGGLSWCGVVVTTESHIVMMSSGVHASGKRACWDGIHVFELENGKIVSTTKQWDKYAVWKHLGWPMESLDIGGTRR